MIRIVRICIIGIANTILCGCSSDPDPSVIEFIKRTKEHKIPYKAVIPKYTPTEPFVYKATNARDPFQPFVLSNAQKPGLSQINGPDLNRPREPLEAFPLDSFQMVGTLERNGIFFALLKDKNQIVHLAHVGNYIGQNSGKIVKVNQNGIEVQEWVADSMGTWREHMAKIQMLKPVTNAKGE